jgi:hypothetical protein
LPGRAHTQATNCAASINNRSGSWRIRPDARRFSESGGCPLGLSGIWKLVHPFTDYSCLVGQRVVTAGATAAAATWTYNGLRGQVEMRARSRTFTWTNRSFGCRARRLPLRVLVAISLRCRENAVDDLTSCHSRIRVSVGYGETVFLFMTILGCPQMFRAQPD